MDLLNLLTEQFTSDSAVSSLAEKSGASTDQITALLGQAMPELLGSLTSNASSQEGAQSLLSALSQHDDTADVADQILNADTEDGEKILGHIFGNNTNNVVSSLAGNSGLSSQLVGMILKMLAPALLSSLFSATNTAAQQQQQQQQSLGGSLVSGLLGNALGGGTQQVQQQQQQSLGGSLLSGLLGNALGGGTQQVQQQQQQSPDLLSLLLSAMQ